MGFVTTWNGSRNILRNTKGQWITINEGMFLGSNENFLELYKAMESSDQLPVALFIKLK
jgi:hypothetical protein